MRPLTLYAPGQANDFVVASLAQFDPVFVVRESPPPLEPVLRVLRRPGPLLARIDRLAFLLFYAAFLRSRLESGLRERLGPHAPPVWHLSVTRINDAFERIDFRALAPDLILVLGTSMLDRRWRELGIPLVNVHTGIAPRYRGRFCWFWPLLEGHADQVGVTLHFADKYADAGHIVRQQQLAPAALGTGSFLDVLHSVTLLARDLCHDLLRTATVEELRGRPCSSLPTHPAYFEPGLTSYLRYLHRPPLNPR